MTMKKAILRGILGIPIGVFISTTIGFIYSLCYGELMVIPPTDGVVTPLNAYIIQYVVSMIIGFTFAACSAIFEVDHWSIAKQTAIHFILTCLVFFPCSIKARWIYPSTLSIIIYISVFIFIYIAIWFSQYSMWKKKVDKLNKKLKENQN